MAKSFPLRALILSVLVGFLSICAAWLIARSQNSYRAPGRDFLAIWIGSHMVTIQQDPYDSTAWLAAHTANQAEWVSHPTYLYPLPLAIILTPLGWLDLDIASVLWATLIILSIMGTFTLVQANIPKPWSRPYWLPTLAGVFLFRPVAVSLRLGQIDPIMLFMIAIAGVFWQRQSKPGKNENMLRLFGGMLLGLTSIKPQFSLPLITLLAFWFLHCRQFRPLVGTGISFTSLFALALLFDPNWLGKWLASGGVKVVNSFCCTPTLWGLASLLTGFRYPLAFWVGGFLVILLLFLVFIRLLHLESHQTSLALLWILPTALLISPYLWVYTQVLLLPPLLFIADQIYRKPWPYLPRATFMILFSLFSFLLVIISARVGVDVLSALVPLATLLMLSWLPMETAFTIDPL